MDAAVTRILNDENDELIFDAPGRLAIPTARTI
jgi:hypothetical protein